MKHIKKTRRRRHSKKILTRKKIRGGARCSTRTTFDRFVITLWTEIERVLRNDYDNRWRFDIHTNRRFQSCNLWGWLPCHTSKAYDTHWDLYFMNRHQIGLSLTFENEHNIRSARYTFDYDGIVNNNNNERDDNAVFDTDSEEFYILVNDLAEWIDDCYWTWVEDLGGWQREDC
jgi:hypothetical protein